MGKTVLLVLSNLLGIFAQGGVMSFRGRGGDRVGVVDVIWDCFKFGIGFREWRKDLGLGEKEKGE